MQLFACGNKSYYNCNKTCNTATKWAEYHLHAIGIQKLCTATVRQPRRHASAAVGRSDATLWLAATCNFMNKIVHAQYYANEVCNVVQLIAALVASFIAVVIGVYELLFYRYQLDQTKTVAYLHKCAAYNKNDELFMAFNIDDLERRWTHKLMGFSEIFNSCGWDTHCNSELHRNCFR